jgi:hypothetical protein
MIETKVCRVSRDTQFSPALASLVMATQKGDLLDAVRRIDGGHDRLQGGGLGR